MTNIHTLTELNQNTNTENTNINELAENYQLTKVLKLRPNQDNKLSPLNQELERIRKYSEENPGDSSFREAFPNYEPSSSNINTTSSLEAAAALDNTENTEQGVTLFDLVENLYNRIIEGNELSNSSINSEVEHITSISEEILNDPQSENLSEDIKGLLYENVQKLRELIKTNISNVGDMTINERINHALALDLNNFINNAELIVYPSKVLPTIWAYRGVMRLFLKYCETKSTINELNISQARRSHLLRIRNLNVALTMTVIAPIVSIILVHTAHLSIFEAFNFKFKLKGNEEAVKNKDESAGLFLGLLNKKPEPKWFKLILFVIIVITSMLFISKFDLLPYFIYFLNFKTYLFICLLVLIFALIVNILGLILLLIFSNKTNSNKLNELNPKFDFKFKFISDLFNSLYFTAIESKLDSKLYKRYYIKYIIIYSITILIILYLL